MAIKTDWRSVAETVVLAIGIGLAFLGAMFEKVTPYPEDCKARGQAEDCWKSAR